jgi:hypothetical protein
MKQTEKIQFPQQVISQIVEIMIVTMKQKNRSFQMKDVVEVVSSNTFASIQQVFEDNLTMNNVEFVKKTHS